MKFTSDGKFWYDESGEQTTDVIYHASQWKEINSHNPFFLHNDDGPAKVGHNGYKVYFKHNKCHKENGPAAVYSEGVSWFWEGKKIV